jgi:hypothetical protein
VLRFWRIGAFLAFWRRWLIGGMQPFAVTAADLNGDGFPDLAVTDSSSSGVVVLLNGADWPAGANAAADRKSVMIDAGVPAQSRMPVPPGGGVLTWNVSMWGIRIASSDRMRKELCASAQGFWRYGRRQLKTHS